MYVPTHLGGVYKTLLQYGHNMRQKHGTEFKRNIRFDDAELSLAIDIKLPGKDSKWVSVTYEHALADRRAWSQSVVSRNLDKLSSRPEEEQEQEPVAVGGGAIAASRLDGLPGTQGPGRSAWPSTSSSSSSSGSLNGQAETNEFADLVDKPNEIWSAPRK